MTAIPYVPRSYWNQRLLEGFPQGTGQQGLSASYNLWLYRSRRRAWLRALRGRRLAGTEVLEVGAGTGYWLERYRRRGARMTGIDIAENAVAALRSRLGGSGEFRLQDAAEPFDLGRRFDLIHCFDVLYHIVEDEAFSSAVANLARHLKPGGRLLVIDRLEDARPSPEVRFRSRAVYDRELGRRGLRILRTEPVFGVIAWRPLILASRACRWLLGWKWPDRLLGWAAYRIDGLGIAQSSFKTVLLVVEAER